MFISSEEMTRRLAEADRRRLALRKASQELSAFGKQILKQRSKAPANAIDRPKRSNRGTARR
jgi:hypothetical protein